MNRFSIGNVVKTKYGSIGIVTKIANDGYVSMVSYDHTNVSSGYRDKTYTEEVWCDCGDCENCRQNKPYIRTVYGMEDSVLIANTVKDWIINSVTSNFKF
jgi:hypothetical protein